MPRPIQLTSAKNPIVHRVKDTAAGEFPDEMVVEGNRLVEDALAAGLPIRVACVSDKLLQAKNGHDLRRRLEQKADEVYDCTDPVLARMSALTTHQGVLAVIEAPKVPSRALLGADPARALIVAAAGVRDPGNLGAMLRATEAAGGTGFVALAGGAHPFRDKAVRGSAGSVLRLPTWPNCAADELAAFANQHRLQMVGTDADAATDYLDLDWTRPTVVVLGNEGAGLPKELAGLCEQTVRIPIQEPVDSLNVAVTTGILLYEARRQRR